METDLRTRLLGATAAAQRVSWVSRPQGKALPALTLTMVSPGRGYSHAGADALQESRVQVDCWGRTHLEASQLAGDVLAALEPAASIGGTEFGQSFLDGDRDMPPEDVPGGTTTFRRTLDFMIWWRPAA